MSLRVPSRVARGLLYALTVFAPLAFGCVEPWSRAILEVLAFSLALATFFRGAPATKPPARWAWVLPAAFAVYGLVQLGHPVRPDFPRPIGPFTADPHATRAAVLLWAAYAAILWSVPRVIVRHETARSYARCLFAVGVVVALLGLLQKFTGATAIYWNRDATGAYFFGPFYNSDHAGSFLLLCFVVSAAFVVARFRRRVPADEAEGPYTGPRARLVAASFLIFVAFAFARSRGAFLALPLAAAVLAFWGADFHESRRARRGQTFAAWAAFGVVLLLAFRIVGESADAGALVDRSIAARFTIYGDAVRWLRDSPFFGTGLGSFETVYPSYQDAELRAVVSQAHSDWLQLALEAGLPGLGAAVLGLLCAVWAAAAGWRGARSSEMRALAAGPLAALLVFGFHAGFEFVFQIPGLAAVFFAVLGFALSTPSWSSKAAPNESPEPRSAWATMTAAAVGLLFCEAAAMPAAAQWHALLCEPARPRPGLAAAYSLDPDPRFLKRSAEALARRALDGGVLDARSARVGLDDALNAAEARPYEASVLLTAAGLLSSLSRAGDAADLSARARAVRFGRLTRTASGDPGQEKRIEGLRAAGVLQLGRRKP